VSNVSRFRFNSIKAVSLYSLLVLMVACTGCGVNAAGTLSSGSARVRGSMHGGRQAVTGATIQLWAANTAEPSSATTYTPMPLLTQTVTTGSTGDFDITGLYTCPSPDAQVYLTGTGGSAGSGTNPNIALMSLLGSCGSLSSSTFILLNEETTVIAANLLGQIYMDLYGNVGATSSGVPAMTAAFSTALEYVNPALGTAPGPSLPSGATINVSLINTMADILAACVNSGGGTAGDGSVCGNLFSLVPNDPTPGAHPTNTIEVAVRMPDTVNPLPTTPFYNLIPANPPFVPILPAAPANWNILSPGIDMVAATTSGNGIVTIPFSQGGSSAFAAEYENSNSSTPTYTLSASTGAPVAATICQTNPDTGQCLAAPATSVSFTGATATFSVFVTASAAISNSPALFVNVTDSTGALVASTSVVLATD
jgi:hypothetical protein